VGRVSDAGWLAVPGFAGREACSVGPGVCRWLAYGAPLVSGVQARAAGADAAAFGGTASRALVARGDVEAQ